MGVKLSQAVPWGRSLAEYVGMFSLSTGDLEKRILGCADGPASFNAEMTARGYRVVSCDPIYIFTAHEIRQRVAATFETIMGQMPAARGNQGNRYVASALPHLPFADSSFDLALCSNFLFLYSEQLGEAFHLMALRELCRVATEVRVFPLLDLDGQVSPHLGPALAMLRREGFHATVRTVPYEFLKGANEMVVIGRHEGSTGLKPVSANLAIPSVQSRWPPVATQSSPRPRGNTLGLWAVEEH